MRRGTKGAVLVALLPVLAILLSGCGQTRMMFGTGGTAGTYYAYGGVLAQYMTNYSDGKVTAVSSGGSKVNIQSIQDGDFQLGFTQSDVMAYAWDGTKSFEQDGPTHDFRVLGALYDETVQLFSMDPDIKSVEDLRGKRVSVGEAGSGVYFNAMDVLEGAGLSLDDIKPQYQSFDASKEALKDGMIDAAFIVAGPPTPAITELATTNGVSFVPIDGDLRDKILADHPYYTEADIPAGTYPGQDEDVGTITVKATVIVSANLSSDLVYEMTGAIFDHMDNIAAENAKGAELSLDTATSGMAAPFHEGAARYYKEHGIEVQTLDPADDPLKEASHD
ncbi:MAG TPA: C4-dicarboxylate ABC transporter substrate-binding protein [Lachnospiraceae bacterium]|nr:C4-dicarboxylate ABC transporter substrate-binding protein [Lachnospiraceae bacterium]